MIKPGDNVRFLNAVGGGRVTRIDEKQNMVYVEDADGCEVPALARECVVIQAVNEKTNFPVKDFSSKKTSTAATETKESSMSSAAVMILLSTGSRPFTINPTDTDCTIFSS